MSINSHSVRLLSIFCIQIMNVGIMRRSQTFHRLSLWRFMNSWMSEWLIWFIACSLSVWGGLESRANAFRQMDIYYKIYHPSWNLLWKIFLTSDKYQITFVWEQTKHEIGKKPHSLNESIEVLWAGQTFIWRLKASPAPPFKSSLLCQMAGPFSPATVHLQLFLGFCTSWETWQMEAQLCTHIRGGGGGWGG